MIPSYAQSKPKSQTSLVDFKEPGLNGLQYDIDRPTYGTLLLDTTTLVQAPVKIVPSDAKPQNWCTLPLCTAGPVEPP